MVCCGNKMTELIPGTSDGAAEKHVPVIVKDGNKVTVKIGDVAHPMIEAHYIQWIVLETENGFQAAYLEPNEEPKAEFVLSDGENVIGAYEYCNLHGLWSAQ